MVRKLVLAVAAASALMSSGVVQALGVGEINLHSALNQPLQADIELLQVRDLSSAEILAALATPDDFGRAGIERPFFLTDLKFTPVVEGGRALIRVTSERPVREPYLNFLIEVRWPSGRVLREFTLLLDPPLYQPAAVTSVSAPVTPPATPPAPIVRAPTPVAAPAAAAPVWAAAARSELQTSRSDTLWDIALQNRPAGASVHQTMLAILDLNPHAFIDGNINQLRAGQTLRLPDAEQARSRSQADAIAQVAQQNASWQAARQAQAGQRQLDARQRETAGAAPAQAERGDALRLVAAADESVDGGADAADQAGNGQLRDVLDRTKEQLDSTEREKAELNERLAEVQGQLDTLQRLLELKDAQLAALQQELGRDEALPDILPEPLDETVAEQELEQVSEELVEEAAQDLAGQPTERDELAELERIEQDLSEDEEPVPAATIAGQEPGAGDAITPPSPPSADVTPASSVDQSPEAMLQRLMQNQTLLLGGGALALLVLLLVLMAVARRNARREAEMVEEFIAETDRESDDTQSASDDFNVALAGFDELEGSEELDIAGDPLTEADALIAYGKLDEAADVLQAAVGADPERDELRLKLMEVHALRNNSLGYAAQAEVLRNKSTAQNELQALDARFPLMAAAALGAAAAVAEDERDQPIDYPAAQATDDAVSTGKPAESEVADDLDFDFSDFEAELNESQLDAEGSAEAAVVDFSLDEPSLTDEQESAESSESAESAESAFDLDFDLDALEPETPAESAQEPAEELTSLDLSEDFDLSLTDDLQADNLLAEFEAGEPVQDGPLSVEDEPQADDDAFALSDEDLMGFEDELSSAMAAQGAQLEEADGDAADDLGDAAEDTASPAEQGVPLGDDMDDDEFDFLSGTDECATKLDLARAYIDMGDNEGARDILSEVIDEGNEQQKQEARSMMETLTD